MHPIDGNKKNIWPDVISLALSSGIVDLDGIPGSLLDHSEEDRERVNNLVVDPAKHMKGKIS